MTTCVPTMEDFVSFLSCVWRGSLGLTIGLEYGFSSDLGLVLSCEVGARMEVAGSCGRGRFD